MRRYHNIVIFVGVIVFSLLLFFVLVGAILWLYQFEWSGFAASQTLWLVEPRKTLWDWLGLFLVPLFLLFGSLVINYAISRSEAQRRAKEQEIEADKEEGVILRNYLDTMTTLCATQPPSAWTGELVAAVRGRTLVTLKQLNGDRKGDVIRFLAEAALISAANPILTLDAANLNETNLGDMQLHGIHLAGVTLRDANLVGVNLTGSNLQNVKLNGARLAGSVLDKCDLHKATLYKANLTGTKLHNAHLREANLDDAVLENAVMSGSDLTGVLITRRTDFSGANLKGCNGATDEQLRIARLSTNTIMPDGRKYPGG